VGNSGSYIGQGNTENDWGKAEIILPGATNLIKIHIAKKGTPDGILNIMVGNIGDVNGTNKLTITLGADSVIKSVVIPSGGILVSENQLLSLFGHPANGSWPWLAATIIFE
jgi:hypothetical protein